MGLELEVHYDTAFEALSKPFSGELFLGPAEVRDIIYLINQAHIEQFQTEGARSGKPWDSLEESTQRDRKRQGFEPEHPILERTGEYRAAMTQPTKVEQTGTGLEISYGEAGGKLANEFGNPDRGLPAREVHDLTDADYDELNNIIVRGIAGAFRGFR